MIIFLPLDNYFKSVNFRHLALQSLSDERKVFCFFLGFFFTGNITVTLLIKTVLN